MLAEPAAICKGGMQFGYKMTIYRLMDCHTSSMVDILDPK
jgi:hypothetical protein